MGTQPLFFSNKSNHQHRVIIWDNTRTKATSRKSRDADYVVRFYIFCLGSPRELPSSCDRFNQQNRACTAIIHLHSPHVLSCCSRAFRFPTRAFYNAVRARVTRVRCPKRYKRNTLGYERLDDEAKIRQASLSWERSYLWKIVRDKSHP